MVIPEGLVRAGRRATVTRAYPWTAAAVGSGAERGPHGRPPPGQRRDRRRIRRRAPRSDQPAGTFQPRASAISLQVGHTGYRFGFRPGTQILPQSALTAVPLTMPSTTEGPAEMKSPFSGLNPSSTMWDIRSWSPSSSGSTWAGASVMPASVMGQGSRTHRRATRHRRWGVARESHRVSGERPPVTQGVTLPTAASPYALLMPVRTLVLASGSPARLRLP